MKNYENGFVRKLSVEEASVYHPRTWYFAHHGVQKPYKPGQWRPVMNASLEYMGTSLNKCNLGPKHFGASTVKPAKYSFLVSNSSARLDNVVDHARSHLLWALQPYYN